MTGACLRCQSPLEPGDLRCAICAMAAPKPRAPAAREAVRVLRCDGCGAALAFVAEAGAPRCAFCASIMRVERPSDPLEVARRVLPFRVSPEQAGVALRAWLSSLGFFRPSNLASSSSLEGLRAIFWCGWLVEADAWVSWAADTNKGAGRAGWAPHAGQCEMRFERLLISASRGLTLDECRRLTPGYDLRGLAPADRAGAGALVEQFDVQRSAARSIVVDAIERTAAACLTREGRLPGTAFRNVRASVLLRGLSTERVGLCAYVLAYRYKGKSYRAVVHGQDARYAFGEAPYSTAKIALAVVAALIVVAGIVAGIVALAAPR